MKAELLFTAAFDRVAATQAKPEYLWDKAVEYADAFDGSEVDPRFPIYTRLFCLRFRPGFDTNPRAILSEANAASVAAIACLEKCKGETPERLENDAQAESDAEARKAASVAEREAVKAKRAAQAKAKADAEASADKLLQPETLEAVKADALEVHGFAKNAFKAAGIETVGEILTYKAARSLSEIKGISDKMEAQVLEAIEAIRPKFAKPDVTDTPPAE